MSGWRVTCPACGAEYLLPAPWAGPGARVRCPGCKAPFRAADPRLARALRETLAAWADAEPGGADAVRSARAAGFFWRAHGESLCAALDAGAPLDPAALEAALAQVFGPGSRLL
jgi:hypothetical protein